MSRSIFVVTALALVLAATFAFAQQAGQQSGQQPSQQQWQSGTSGAGSTAGMTMQQRLAAGAQRVATIAEQQNIDLYKAVQAAEKQAKGKAIAAVLLTPRGQQATAGSAGESGAAGQAGAGGSAAQQSLNAHVAIATENQLHFVAVDAKENKVLDTQSRPFIQNLWSQQGAADAQEQAGQGTLTQSLAQRIYRQVDQYDGNLHKAIQAAESHTKGRAVAAFFALRGQMAAARGAAARDTGDSSAQGGSQAEQDLTARVFTISGSQLQMAVVDAKENKVLNVETRQMIQAPWESERMGAGGTMGREQAKPSDADSDAKFPTGSGSGRGPGTLGE